MRSTSSPETPPGDIQSRGLDGLGVVKAVLGLEASLPVSLDEIASDPQRAAALSPEIARALLARCIVVQGWLLVSALAPSATKSPVGREGSVVDDRLLTVRAAAAKLGVSRDWIYRRTGKLPFTVRLGPRRLRFSETGIERFIAQRQGKA